MSEEQAIQLAKSRGPATVDLLLEDLRQLGVRPGQTLLVHTSLSQLGWVCGGAMAVIEALDRVVGKEGTLVMPTHSANFTDPSHWSNPPVPESWWNTIRTTMPAFDPLKTPSQRMGIVAETFRTQPEVIRSDHPVGSFAARGPSAKSLMATHPLEQVFGRDSPLGRLYEQEASLLLLGVGHENNTSLHLAEAHVRTETRPQGAPILKAGCRVWKTYQEPLHDSDDFDEIGQCYATQGGRVRTGLVGSGEALLAPIQEMVDFAVHWMVDRQGADV